MSRPSQAATGITPPGSIQVQREVFAPLPVSAVRPGDILLDYRPRHKTWRHHLITTAQRLASCHGVVPRGAGSINVIHAALVVGSDSAQNLVNIAEACGRERRICLKVMDFDHAGAPNSNVFLHTHYLVFRLGDADLASSMATTARQWAVSGSASFSNRKMLAGLLLPPRSTSAKAMRPFLDSLENTPCDSQGRPIPMFCSEFVTTVGATSSLRLAAEDPTRVASNDGLFDVAPGTVLPTSLHRRLTRDANVQRVGYLSSDTTPSLVARRSASQPACLRSPTRPSSPD